VNNANPNNNNWLTSFTSFFSAHTNPVYLSPAEYDKEKNCSTDPGKNPTNPMEYLTNFNCGRVSVDSSGNTLREFTLIVKENVTIPVSDQGNTFNAWTFNGTVPGPTMRMTEGDHIRITVINSNSSQHSHTIHMHSIHPGVMDGVMEVIPPGHSYTYDFIAQPYGLFPYHCHVSPVEDHINRGLYGMIIIDPKTPRPKATEFAMLMNGYDMNLTHEGHPFSMPPSPSDNATIANIIRNNIEISDSRGNDIYTVNGIGFYYQDHPIQLKVGQPVRIYLVNMLEFDPVNQFHLHGNMFDYYPAGTYMNPSYKTDIVTLSQGDRGIIEFTPKFPGMFMFHAHSTEFTEKGWMGFFNVTN
jgi:FtsP/CotA-like multicopper oxidase with cupredoxin domain